MSDSLAALLDASFARHRTKVLLDAAGRTLTGSALADLAARSAHWLTTQGVGAGDRVVAQVEKSVDAVVLYLAALRAGAVYVPLNTAYTPAEVDAFAADAEPKLIVCDAARLDAIAPIGRASGAICIALDGPDGVAVQAATVRAADAIVARDHDDVAAIVYTSGTTGRSKGAMLTHGNLASNARALVALWGFTNRDVLLHALPIYHVHGLFVGLHTAFASGATIRFHARFDTGAVLADLPGSTVFMGVPTYYTRLLDDARLTRERCGGVRLFVSGSAPLLESTFAAFEVRTGHRILERYGMSEAGMITSNPLDGDRIAGTVGMPLPGVAVRVRKPSGAVTSGGPGVLEIRGPNVFAGYWRMPEKTREEFTADGWFVTGDVAVIDAQGRVSIVGRDKDLIISGGLNVYPKEVELLLDALPGVGESAVFGVPHADFGEAVVAAIVPASGARPAEMALIASLRERLASFKIPKRLLVVSELPRNAMGKVQKNVLRAEHAALFR